MANEISTEFSVARGLEMQKNDLRQWRIVLRPTIYARLESLVEANNVELQSGYDVCRGSEIDQIVHTMKNF